MADHVDITLWIDRRWKDAIEKHLKDETLQEHLEDVLDGINCHVCFLLIFDSGNARANTMARRREKSYPRKATKNPWLVL